MSKNKVTLEVVRKAIIDGSHGMSAEAANMSDEEFLQAELDANLEMDSLDIVEMTMEIERRLGISIAEEMFSAAIQKPMTVADYIEGCNKFASELR